MTGKIVDVPSFVAAHHARLHTFDPDGAVIGPWRVRIRERLRGGRLHTHGTVQLDGVRDADEMEERIDEGIAGLRDEHNLRLEMVLHAASTATMPTGFISKTDPDSDEDPDEGIAPLLGDGGKDSALVALVDGYYRMALSFKDDNVKLRELLFRREGEHHDTIVQLALREGARAALEGRDEELASDRERAQFWQTASALLPHFVGVLNHSRAQAAASEPGEPPSSAERWADAWSRMFAAGGELSELFDAEPELLDDNQKTQLRFLLERVSGWVS